MKFMQGTSGLCWFWSMERDGPPAWWGNHAAVVRPSRSFSALWSELSPGMSDFCVLICQCSRLLQWSYLDSRLLEAPIWRILQEKSDGNSLNVGKTSKFGCWLEVFCVVDVRLFEIRANVLKIELIKQHRQCVLSIDNGSWLKNNGILANWQ